MSAVRSLSALALVLAPAGGGLAAQIPIRLGQTVTGRLTVADQQFRDGSRYKMYAFVGNKGDTITAQLSSDDFDANLILADGSGNPLAKNDDGGENCSARLSHVLSAAGNYRLFANSSAPAELGEFRLWLAKGRAPAPADTTCRGFGRVAGMIQVGQTVTGALSDEDPLLTSDSSYYQRWILPLEPNQTVTVDLESDDFDAYVIVTRGRGDKLGENDDGGGGCHARLVYTASDDHPVRLVVNTAGKLQAGRFTLRVSDGESPVEPKGDCRFRRARADRRAAGDTAAAAADIRERTRDAVPVGRTVSVGGTAQGELTRNDVLRRSDSTYAQRWEIQGTAGHMVTIDLESDAFDPFLFLSGPGIESNPQDDDSGGNCNARLTATFPRSGTYTIIVNTADKYATGPFSLSVTAGSKPKSLSRCSRSR